MTCNEPLPLRVLITKLNDTTATIHLKLLHIELIARTTVRAHHLNRTNQASWVILSRSNMQTQLIEKNKIMELDRNLWKDIPLPNTVAPSFDTCNITRSYYLDIKVGLSYGKGSTVYVSSFLPPSAFHETLPLSPLSLCPNQADHDERKPVPN